MAGRRLAVSLFVLSCCHVSSGIPSVVQTPDISVTEGETLTISCCWTLEAQRFIVNWVKNGTIVNILQMVNFSGALDTSDCLKLTLTNISQEDSGRYICRVLTELPHYSVLEGKGTVITVQAKGGTETPEASHHENVTIIQQMFTLFLRSLPFLALTVTFICINRVGARGRRHEPTTMEDRGNEQRGEIEQDGQNAPH